MAAFMVRTPSAGPAGWFQTAPITARKSAPACTKGAQFAAVIPPMATEGISNISCHQVRISGVARWMVALLSVGKKAPKAT